MFWSVLRPSSGVIHCALRNYYVSACLPHHISVCGGMSSVLVYLRCTCQWGVWMCTHPDTTLTGTGLAQLLRVSMPASSHSSLWRYVVCTCILVMYLSVRCLDVYSSRHHTDRYIASIHVQTTYRHRLECDEAGMLTPSNCARHSEWPLTMVGGLTEICWVL